MLFQIFGIFIEEILASKILFAPFLLDSSKRRSFLADLLLASALLIQISEEVLWMNEETPPG
jgi:hypothetical protein